MAKASGRTSGHSDASVAGEQSAVRQRQRREPGKPTWRCLDRLSLSFAWLAPLNRGSLNSAHIHGTHVPVEEPSTASTTEVAVAAYSITSSARASSAGKISAAFCRFARNSTLCGRALCHPAESPADLATHAPV